MEKNVYMVALEPEQEFTSRFGLALNYPPHVTVKSRFIASNLDDLVKSFEKIYDFELRVSSCESVNSCLYWLRSKEGYQGFEYINSIHNTILKIINDGNYDNISNSMHEGKGYIPHLTISWYEKNKENSNDILKQIYTKSQVLYIKNICIYKYKLEMENSPVEVVFREKLNTTLKVDSIINGF